MPAYNRFYYIYNNAKFIEGLVRTFYCLDI